MQKGNYKLIKILNLIIEIIAILIIKLEIPRSTSLHNDSKKAIKTLIKYTTNLIFIIFKLTALSFLNNSSYSDIIILFGIIGIEFPAYRIILIYRSFYIYNSLIKVLKTEILQFNFNSYSIYLYWRVFYYIYKKKYSI